EYSPLPGFRVLRVNSKNSNPKFTGERQIFHYTFLFDAYDLPLTYWSKARALAGAVRRET
uniref:hypothetical protein n=1 Tax=Enterocloster clostridioformis TaxID=1531 RepID=UPI0025A59FD4